MTEEEANRAVARALFTEVSMWSYLWQQVPMVNEEVFTRHAKVVLGDQTEIEGDALRNANWPELYKDFKKLSEE